MPVIEDGLSVSREQVRSVPCPECGSPAEEKCIGVRQKVRESNHASRWSRYIERSRSQGHQIDYIRY